MSTFTDLDEVWFVISPQNPLKEKHSLLADYHRLALVKLAVEDHPKMKAVDIEFKMPKPSYTIDTLTWLNEKYPDRSLIVICGADIFQTFHKWKNYQQILDQYYLYVYPRPGFALGEYAGHPHISMFDAPNMEISSSFIRNGIRNKKDMQFWMPSKVYNYILEMHFYEK
jgi:nicotinate-nucleotide adenylyltransferase